MIRINNIKIDVLSDNKETIIKKIEIELKEKVIDYKIVKKSIDARKEFTDELKNKGIQNSKDFAALTNILTKAWSGYSVKEYKNLKNLKKESLRDNMTNMELVLNMLAEVSSTEISKSKKEKGYVAAESSVINGGTIAKTAKEQIEKETGTKIVTSANNINVKQIDNK